jgi:hypothetical protein
MSGPEKDHDTNDAALLYDLFEGSILGSSVITIVGFPQAGLYTHTEIGRNREFNSLGPVVKVEFLTSAIAKLQVMLADVR